MGIYNNTPVPEYGTGVGCALILRVVSMGAGQETVSVEVLGLIDEANCRWEETFCGERFLVLMDRSLLPEGSV